VGPSDLILALRICATAQWPFTGIGEENLENDERVFRALVARPGLHARAVHGFVNWMLECSLAPETWEDRSGDSRAITAPVCLGLAVRLLRLGSMTEERVWTMPLGLVRAYALAISEQEGGSARFLTTEDVEAMRQCDELPDLTKATEEEIFEVVKRDRGEAFARAFSLW
jgi:hypothetical protein